MLDGVSEQNLVEADDVDDPGTETGRCRGFQTHKLWIELRITQILVFDHTHCGFRDMLFIKINQCL